MDHLNRQNKTPGANTESILSIELVYIHPDHTDSGTIVYHPMQMVSRSILNIQMGWKRIGVDRDRLVWPRVNWVTIAVIQYFYIECLNSRPIIFSSDTTKFYFFYGVHLLLAR